MTYKETIIHTGLDRTLKVTNLSDGAHLTVTDTGTSGESIPSHIYPEQVTELITALAGDNATVVTDLPEAYMNEWGRIVAGGCDRSKHSDPAEVLTIAKELLAVHAFLVKHYEEQAAAEKAKEAAEKAAAEAEKAKEAARKARRDQLVKEFGSVEYSALSYVSKQAFDRIIELEEAAKAPKAPKVPWM